MWIDLQSESMPADAIIQIYDYQGRELKEKRFQIDRGQWEINTSNLTKGIYIMRINIDGKSVSRKFVVE